MKPIRGHTIGDRRGEHLCRSELARDGIKSDAFYPYLRVIVNHHREQVRSYRGAFGALFMTFQRFSAFFNRRREGRSSFQSVSLDGMY
jgi:hypothetical protein